MIQIAILGFGVVGSGTAEVLTENRAIIEERLGCEYNIKYILDLRDFPNSPFGSLITHSFDDILNDPEVSVVADVAVVWVVLVVVIGSVVLEAAGSLHEVASRSDRQSRAAPTRPRKEVRFMGSPFDRGFPSSV